MNTLLKSKELLRTESFVMNLGSRLNQVLEVCPEEEVAQVHEFAVIGILNVDDSPTVLASTNRLAVDDHIALGTYHSKGYHGLRESQ